MIGEEKIKTIKTAPPPPELPIQGRVKDGDVSFLGRTNYVATLEEKRFLFGIKRQDRRRHIYVIGKSNVGKSKLIEVLARQDIAQGYGLCVMDPHGDIIESLLDFIPASRRDDVVIVDLSRQDFLPAFNPFLEVDERFTHRFVKEFSEIIESQLGARWDPRMEQVVRFAVQALLEIPNSVLPDIIKLLTKKEFREEAAAALSDESVRAYWNTEFDVWKRQERIDSEVIAPLVNRIEQFISDPILKPIFSQAENRLRFDKFIDERKIILVNLSRGDLGRENANLFGSLIITKIKEAAMVKSHSASHEERDFYLYLDEFQGLVTEALEHLMFDAKRYHISITLSHQYLGQIIAHFRSSILANVGTIIVFRVGGDDAEKLESEFGPVFKGKDMTILGQGEFYIKMLIDGETHAPFSAESLSLLKPPQTSLKSEILGLSQKKYGFQNLKKSRAVAGDTAK